MGIRFLKHLDRTRLLLHLIDVAENLDRDPVQDYRVILTELRKFSPAMAEKPMLVVASKVDAASQEGRLLTLRRLCARQGERLYEISSLTGAGLGDLTRAVWSRLEQIPRPAAPDALGSGINTAPVRQG